MVLFRSRRSASGKCRSWGSPSFVLVPVLVGFWCWCRFRLRRRGLGFGSEINAPLPPDPRSAVPGGTAGRTHPAEFVFECSPFRTDLGRENLCVDPAPDLLDFPSDLAPLIRVEAVQISGNVSVVILDYYTRRPVTDLMDR